MDLVKILKANKNGMYIGKVHKEIRKNTKLSLLVINEVLSEIGEEKSRKWFVKRPQDMKPPTTGANALRSSKSPAISPSASKSPADPKWEEKKYKRIKKPSVAQIEAKQLPKGYGVIEDVVDFDDKRGTRCYLVRWEKVGNQPRDQDQWILKSHFYDFKHWAEKITLLERWKASGLDKATFFKTDPDAKAYREVRKRIAADGDGWCSFRAVGVALDLLVHRQVVTTKFIEEFQAEGLKVNPDSVEKQCGTRWPEVLSFTQRLCGKKNHNIKLDYDELRRNRSKNGTGLSALQRMDLEPGIYLMAGYDLAFNAGHCVVLEVHEDKVIVHEEDAMGGVENLNWLHQLSYVRRFKLIENIQSRL
jgi:hypothetical protein